MQFDNRKLILRPVLPGRQSFETLSNLWDKMIEEEKLHYFCAVQNPSTWSPEEWEKKIQRINASLILVFYINELIGFIQLENIRPRRAEGHWMMFGSMSKLYIYAGREAIRRLLKVLELDCIYGFTPIIFTQAIKYLHLIGGDIVGTLTKGSYIETLGHSIDSVVFEFTRGG